jgi:hypothetical protein
VHWFCITEIRCRPTDMLYLTLLSFATCRLIAGSCWCLRQLFSAKIVIFVSYVRVCLCRKLKQSEAVQLGKRISTMALGPSPLYQIYKSLALAFEIRWAQDGP